MGLKTEKEVRKEMFEYARKIGAEKDLEQLIDKWDKLIALAPENEKTDMCRSAILAVQDLLDIRPERGDGLTINDEVIIEAAPENKKWKSWGKVR